MAGALEGPQERRPWGDEANRITENVKRIQYLKRRGYYQDALGFIRAEIDLQESDARRVASWAVAPWYYEQAAILYRKLGRLADEVAILERYERQRKAPGASPAALAARLLKARALLAKQAERT